jgi:hypothetical protein
MSLMGGLLQRVGYEVGAPSEVRAAMRCPAEMTPSHVCDAYQAKPVGAREVLARIHDLLAERADAGDESPRR